MPRSPCSDLPPVHGSPQCRGIPTGRRRDQQQEDRVAALVFVQARRSDRPDGPAPCGDGTPLTRHPDLPR